MKSNRYILFVIMFFLINMFIVNFVTWRNRGSGKIVLSNRMRGVFFLFIDIKRFSWFILCCQVFNYVILLNMFFTILIINKGTPEIFQMHCSFEKYYIICLLLLSEGNRTCTHIYDIYKKRKSGKNEVFHILGNMEGYLYHIGEDEVMVVKPAVVKGVVFIVLEGLHYYISEINNENEIILEKPVTLEGYIGIMMEGYKDNISEIYYKDIFCELLSMNQMLVCIKKYPVVSLENYVMTIKEVSFLLKLDIFPIYLLGCGVGSVLETMMVYYAFKTNGMFLISEISEKKFKKKLKMYVEEDFYKNVVMDKCKTCIANIYNMEKLKERDQLLFHKEFN